MSISHSLSGNASLLKAKASKHSIIGTVIAMCSIIIATILSGYFTTGEIGLSAFLSAQRQNMVLWFLDAMPFVFCLLGAVCELDALL